MVRQGRVRPIQWREKGQSLRNEGSSQTPLRTSLATLPNARGKSSQLKRSCFLTTCSYSCLLCRFLVRVSYLELYNEEVRDLLSKDPRKRLDIRERADVGVYVKDLLSFVVKNADEMDKLMSIGNKNSMLVNENPIAL